MSLCYLFFLSHRAGFEGRKYKCPDTCCLQIEGAVEGYKNCMITAALSIGAGRITCIASLTLCAYKNQSHSIFFILSFYILKSLKYSLYRCWLHSNRLQSPTVSGVHKKSRAAISAWLELKVQIKITEVRNCYSTGFCWLAYTRRQGIRP